MKGKQNKKRLKPILKKSMLTALGLGIALPIGGTLPQVNAGEIGPEINISRPVLNEGIHWLNKSSEQNDPSFVSGVPIDVMNRTVTIDLSTHFHPDEFNIISATSGDYSVASVYIEGGNKLVVVPYRSGKINIELKAKYTVSDVPETVTDNFELNISKQGDVNNDGKVNSSDAAALLKHLRNNFNLISYSAVEMNRMDVDRDGEVFWSDPQALLEGYADTTLGAKDNRYVLTFKQVDDAPYVLNGELKYDMQIGNAIGVDYYLMDVDVDGDDIHTPSYQWYRATDALGEDMVPIVGETRDQYTVRNEDVDYYLVLEVVAKSSSDANTEPRRVYIVGKEKIQRPD
ncbi:dockerin type I repeat-containing protein [Paenibacillus sp. ClWae2A]|uniref:dockerin type I repeat-containing protein n=1 Tax=Paenibacillus sp. ClWae2A TaxID=3057177 RepID=UPI0028F4F777|nr:dockerin type I repeat-containing protein [Paenibacillus sp. ClWae2A]MDT9717268.1 dockerin type I repeat-containing protein [Paenibacillus sp. ClWae2A]